MCAINGIVYFKPISKKKLWHKINIMQHITHHRGPDQSDTVLFDRAALGTNRLAIVAPTEDTTIQSLGVGKKYIVFNGEIVNQQELRNTLPRHPLTKHSDTSLILPLFEKLGQSFIKKLAGMFAIAIYDEKNQVLQLWRDPLGIKPLYYYHSKDCVIFSSEVKAIYAVMDSAPPLDFAAVDHILRYRFQPGRSTVFPDIKRVLPGETVVFSDKKIRYTQYWMLQSNTTTPTKIVSIEEFRDLFTHVIGEHAQADVPGGFFVSGGLDSSLATAVALRVPSSPYRQPISIRFSPNPVIDETYGKLLEKHFNKKFEWVEISDSLARKTLTELVFFMDEPLENPIHVGTYLMAQRARELGIKSVITGDGSDEFFLGYERHACWFTSADPIADYPKLHWTMTPEEARELYTSEVYSLLRPMVDGRNHIIEPFLTMKQVLLFERGERLPEYHNMRLDRMTMAHGVEAKVPFLDHRIVEYSLKIPAQTLFGSTAKEWLQKAAKPWLPPEILHRPKVLFPSLSNQWLSGEGATWTAEILLDPGASIHHWMKPEILERYIHDHDHKIQLRGKLLWALLALELWLKKY